MLFAIPFCKTVRENSEALLHNQAGILNACADLAAGIRATT